MLTSIRTVVVATLHGRVCWRSSDWEHVGAVVSRGLVRSCIAAQEDVRKSRPHMVACVGGRDPGYREGVVPRKRGKKHKKRKRRKDVNEVIDRLSDEIPTCKFVVPPWNLEVWRVSFIEKGYQCTSCETSEHHGYEFSNGETGTSRRMVTILAKKASQWRTRNLRP